MKNIEWICFFPVYLISFYHLYSCLNIGKTYCKITVDNKKLLSDLFINYILSLIILGISFYFYLNKNGRVVWLIFNNSMMAFIIIFNILDLKNYGSITTKGIYHRNKLIKWKYIQSYTCFDENSLQINCVSSHNIYTKIFENSSISKETLDNIFNNHIELQTENPC